MPISDRMILRLMVEKECSYLDEDIMFGCSAYGEDRNWHTLHQISWFRFVTVSNT